MVGTVRFTPFEPLCGLSTGSGLWATCIVQKADVAPIHEVVRVFGRVERVPEAFAAVHAVAC